MLRDAGTTVGRFDASDWDLARREPARHASDKRARALRQAHEATAYNHWLVTEIQEAIDDPGPSVPHEEVMACMDADVARHKAAAGAKQA